MSLPDNIREAISTLLDVADRAIGKEWHDEVTFSELPVTTQIGIEEIQRHASILREWLESQEWEDFCERGDFSGVTPGCTLPHQDFGGYCRDNLNDKPTLG